jgi:acyl-coenzyme A synthetase/AMP-(fatty) acid ligase
MKIRDAILPWLPAARLALLALLGIGIGILLWALFWRPGALKKEATVANANAVIAESRTKAAQDTIKTMERTSEKITRIETIRDRGVAAVLAAPDDVSAGSAARAAACRLLDSYRLQQPCPGLLDDGAGEPAAPDTGLPLTY